MGENPLGGKAGDAHQEVQARANRDDAAPNRSQHREWKSHSASLQRSRDHHSDVLLVKEGQILTERWRVEYNTERPHSALGYRQPAPQAILPQQQGHGDIENAPGFPHLHVPGGDYGQMSSKELH
jgi:Integrase core domain